jgi:hypothetical protein
VFDVANDFQDKWSLHTPPDLCSLSHSGPTGARHFLLLLIHPGVPPFDRGALAGFEAAGKYANCPCLAVQLQTQQREILIGPTSAEIAPPDVSLSLKNPQETKVQSVMRFSPVFFGFM